MPTPPVDHMHEIIQDESNHQLPSKHYRTCRRREKEWDPKTNSGYPWVATIHMYQVSLAWQWRLNVPIVQHRAKKIRQLDWRPIEWKTLVSFTDLKKGIERLEKSKFWTQSKPNWSKWSTRKASISRNLATKLRRSTLLWKPKMVSWNVNDIILVYWNLGTWRLSLCDASRAARSSVTNGTRTLASWLKMSVKGTSHHTSFSPSCPMWLILTMLVHLVKRWIDSN